MKLTVDVDPQVVWQIHDLAEQQNTTVDELIVRSVLHEFLPRPSTAQTVVALVAAGWCDADIASRLGLTNTRVKDHRLNANLPANRRFVKAWKYQPKGKAA